MPAPGSAVPPLTDLRQHGAVMAREGHAWQEGRLQGASEMASAVQAFLNKLANGDYGLLPPELFRDANALLSAVAPKLRS